MAQLKNSKYLQQSIIRFNYFSFGNKWNYNIKPNTAREISVHILVLVWSL